MNTSRPDQDGTNQFYVTASVTNEAMRLLLIETLAHAVKSGAISSDDVDQLFDNAIAASGFTDGAACGRLLRLWQRTIKWLVEQPAHSAAPAQAQPAPL